jgi:SAM-dependent methyltransferase
VLFLQWHETRVMREFRDRRFKHHSLLGLRTVESTDFEPDFRNLFHLEASPWVRDHTINGDVVYPFAAYVAMAGEAVRQITGVQHGFKLRNTTATTALVVHEDKPVELITAFRRRKLADGSDSRWWDFGISSHNGHVWVRNFSGEATALTETETLGSAEQLGLPELPRHVVAERWYAAVDRTGFHYGPTFRCLKDVKAATTQPGRVTATIEQTFRHEEESDYHIHPTAVDNVFQMLPVASLLGRGRKLGLNVITGIGEISITRCASDVVLTASVSGRTAGNASLLVGGGECAVDGRTVLRMSDTTFSVLGYPDEGDVHAAARHVWSPHVDFVAPEKLLKPAQLEHGDDLAAALAELTDLALLYTSKTLYGLEEAPAADHLRRYQSWIATQTATMQDGAQLDSNDDGLLEKIGAKAHNLQGLGATGDLAEAIYRVTAGLGDILTGKQDGMDLLSKGDLLNKIVGYVNNEVDNTAFFGNLAHTQPNLRVLELGAGFGALTDKHLQGLGSLYSKYTFTDASQRLVAEGKERFKDRANMEFAALDVGGDLATYGFDLGGGERAGYDLIIATNVLNQTDDLLRSMRNIRSLLNAGGRLLLQELAPPSTASRWATFVLGSLPIWWRGVPNGNQGLGIAGTALEEALHAVGFAQPDIKVLADSKDAPFQLNNVVVARPAASNEPKLRQKQVAILTADAADGESPEVSDLHQKLAARGYDVSRITLADDKPLEVGRDIVALLDHNNGSFLSDMSSEAYQRLNLFLLDLAKSQAGLFWVTGPSSTGTVSDPHYGLVVGLARTLRSEIDAEFAVCQTASGDFAGARVVDVFEHFHGRSPKAVDVTLDSEMEYVISDDGEVNVGRYYPFRLSDELLEREGANGEAVLAIGRPGNLDALHWVQCATSAPGDDEVEVEVYAAGLNDKVCKMSSNYS